MSGTIQELGVNSHKDTVPIFKELIVWWGSRA